MSEMTQVQHVPLKSPQALDLTRPTPTPRPMLKPRSELTPKSSKTAPPAIHAPDQHSVSALGQAAPSLPLTTASQPSKGTPTPTQAAASKSTSANGYNPRLGQNLAKAGIRAANSMRSENWCFRGVKKALKLAYGKPILSGEFAYEAAAQLTRNPRFKEISVPAADLRKLPAGAIVVWKASRANNAGHISIALGDGRESSDQIRKQMTRNHGAGHRVFIPIK